MRTLRVTETRKLDYVPLPTILKDIDKYSITKGRGQIIDPEKLENKLIAMLYFDNTLIARNDYYEMKISNVNKKIKDLDDKFNHLLYNPKTNSVVKFVMFQYKTNKKFAKQEFVIPADLRKILNKYIEVEKKKVGEFLFTTQTGLQYQDSNFINRIKKANQSVIGKPISVDLIRKIHIVNFFKGKQRTINEKKAFASRFLHSADVQQEYNKLDL